MAGGTFTPGEFKEVHPTIFRIVACKGESDKGDFVGRDNGPIALVLGNKERSKERLRPFNGCREMY